MVDIKEMNTTDLADSVINPSGWEVRELVPLHTILLILFILVILTLPLLIVGIWKVTYSPSPCLFS